jgi:hypothetical protein
MRIGTFILLALFLFVGCNQKKISNTEIEFYFDESEKQEVLAKIISYIYISPKGVKDEDRFLAQHRNFYLKESNKFKMVRFFKDEENRYYFYLVRPARNVNNHKRGVGGFFTLDKTNLEIDQFEEVFVTKMIPETDVINFGNVVFQDFIKNKGRLEMTPLRKDIVEFPSFMSEYDTVKKMWVYKEPDSFD